MNKFAVFETILFEGKDINTARKFDKTIKMGKEGVYATYFVFSRVKKVIAGISLPEEVHEVNQGYLENIFGDYFDVSQTENLEDNEEEANRLLRASNEINLNNPHLIIRGNISYLNSFGYLNAEEYPML